MRFSIKDILWLTVVVGLAIEWRLHYENMRQFLDEAQTNIEKWGLERRILRDELDKLRRDDVVHKYEVGYRMWRSRILEEYKKVKAENESLKGDLEAQRLLLDDASGQGKIDRDS